MSRIGKKPIPVPKGVTVKLEGNTVLVQGPKGKLDTPLPGGIKVEQKDGQLLAVREDWRARCSTTPSRVSPKAGPANWKSWASATAPR
jgi:ribosomal protein L6P/L9E